MPVFVATDVRRWILGDWAAPTLTALLTSPTAKQSCHS